VCCEVGLFRTAAALDCLVSVRSGGGTTPFQLRSAAPRERYRACDKQTANATMRMTIVMFLSFLG
jgi:hypothetical protein